MVPSDVHANLSLDIAAEVQKLRNKQSMGGFWAAWQLTISASKPQDLALNLESMHSLVASQNGDASLWLAKVDPIVSARLAAMRLLFAGEHVPTLLQRPPHLFQGVLSARGLSEPGSFGIWSIMNLYAAWHSPWVIAVTSPRLLSVVIELAGELWDGDVDPPDDLLALFTPLTLSSPKYTPAPVLISTLSCLSMVSAGG